MTDLPGVLELIRTWVTARLEGSAVLTGEVTEGAVRDLLETALSPLNEGPATLAFASTLHAAEDEIEWFAREVCVDVLPVLEPSRWRVWRARGACARGATSSSTASR